MPQQKINRWKLVWKLAEMSQHTMTTPCRARWPTSLNTEATKKHKSTLLCKLQYDVCEVNVLLASAQRVLCLPLDLSVCLMSTFCTSTQIINNSSPSFGTYSSEPQSNSSLTLQPSIATASLFQSVKLSDPISLIDCWDSYWQDGLSKEAASSNKLSWCKLGQPLK